MEELLRDEHTKVDSTQKKPLSWQAHEYLHTDKSADWYWTLGLIAVAGAVGALLLNNILFAILIVMGAFVLALFASREPELITFKLTQRGVRIDKQFHPYTSIESFFVEELPEGLPPKLLLKSKSWRHAVIVIPLENIDEDMVHDYLIDFLDEVEDSEPLIHRMMEYFGF